MSRISDTLSRIDKDSLASLFSKMDELFSDFSKSC